MKKILILEDEEILGRVYKKKLEGAGFEVLWTKTIQDTEQMVHQFSADLILLDHGISGHEKAGVDIIFELRKVLPATKIVMLSNYSDFELQSKALYEGADAYLVKINTPPKALVAYIRDLIG